MSQPPSTDWREDIAPDESERFERHAQFLHTLQVKNGKRGMGRALHKKATLGVHATFEIGGAVPAEARAGLFARPGSYKTYVRFSNGSPAHLPDKKPDVRGIALKLVGVSGKKIIPGMEDAPTQDFLLIHTPATPFHDADEFIAAVRAASNPALALPRLIGAFGFGRTLKIARKLMSSMKPPKSLTDLRFYSALPVRWGTYAAKYSLTPVEAGSAPGPTAGRDQLGADLAARLTRGSLAYDFSVQLYRDPTRTPIEDGATEWLESDAPWIPVARLTIPQQDPLSPAGRALAEKIEKLSFDPWHALEEHRPLGNMMRARNHAYRVSTQARGVSAEPSE